jgi:hypothetical protein
MLKGRQLGTISTAVIGAEAYWHLNDDETSILFDA